MSAKKITFMSLLTASALIIFIVEAQLPPLLPIPGIKPGLANIITLLAIAWLGQKEAFTILIMRIALGCIFTGNMMVLAFSLSGGIAAFIFMSLTLKVSGNIIVSSVTGAIAHNAGQILIAVLLTKTPQIFYYLPFLILSAVITGLFTGAAAYFIINRINKI